MSSMKKLLFIILAVLFLIGCSSKTITTYYKDGFLPNFTKKTEITYHWRGNIVDITYHNNILNYMKTYINYNENGTIGLESSYYEYFFRQKTFILYNEDGNKDRGYPKCFNENGTEETCTIAKHGCTSERERPL